MNVPKRCSSIPPPMHDMMDALCWWFKDHPCAAIEWLTELDITHQLQIVFSIDELLDSGELVCTGSDSQARKTYEVTPLGEAAAERGSKIAGEAAALMRQAMGQKGELA